MVQMLGWLRAEAAWASRWNRARAWGSRATSSGSPQRAFVLRESRGKGGRTGEEPLLERDQHEVGGELFRVIGAAGLSQLGILLQHPVNGSLFRRSSTDGFVSGIRQGPNVINRVAGLTRADDNSGA